MCHSNDPRYKRRKHRKKQQQARQRLQASSRQAVQESATVTATARPLLNLSTMAATSTVSSQPSRTRSQPGRPSVAKIIRSVVAQLRAFNLVSATQCGAVVRCVTSAYPGKSNDGTVPQDISCETVHRSIVEGGIVCDLKVAEWMASSSSLFIGIDESTKSTKRSFVELEIGGQLRSTDPDLHIWCVPLTVKEVVSHFTEKMLELMIDEFQRINEIQCD